MTSRAQTCRVLLITPEEPRFRHVLHALAAEAGFEVQRSNDLLDALRSLREESFDAALLDLGLPGVHGPGSVALLRGAAPETALIVTAADMAPGVELEVLELGAQECINRPAEDDRTALVAAVQRALVRKARDTSAPLDTMIALSTDAILTVDRSCTITRFNAAAEDLYGQAAADVLGQHVSVLTSKADDEHSEHIQRVIAGEHDVWFETCHRRDDGEQVHVAISCSPVTDAAGATVEVCEICRDITELVETHRWIMTEQARLEASQAAGRIGSWEYHLRTGQVIWSREEFLLHKLDPQSDPPTLAEILEGIHPDDRESVMTTLWHGSGPAEGPIECEFRVIREPGDIRTLVSRGEVVTDAAGRPRGLVGTTFDITELRAEQVAREAAEEQLRRVFDDSLVGMAIADLEGRHTQVNDALCRLLGRGLDELIGSNFDEFTHPDDRQSRRDLRERLVAGAMSSAIHERRYVRPDGEIVWAEVSVRLVRDPAGNPSHFVLQAQDVTGRRTNEERLRHMVEHDPLTGLLNRRGLERAMHRHASEVERYGRSGGALLMIDLDNFKRHNDTHGHEAGDELLADIGQCLQETLRASDISARLGGDEFIVLLPEADMDQAETVANSLRIRIHATTLRHTTEPQEPAVTASIGVAPFNKSVSPETIMRMADRAMYRAKAGGRDAVILQTD